MLNIQTAFLDKINSKIQQKDIIAKTFDGKNLDVILDYSLYCFEKISITTKDIAIYRASPCVESIAILFILILSDVDVCIIPEEVSSEAPLYKKLCDQGLLDGATIFSHKESIPSLSLCLDSVVLPSYEEFVKMFEGSNTQRNNLSIESAVNSTRLSKKVYFTSSGSSGTPKIIPLSLININACFESCNISVFSGSDFLDICCVHNCSFVIILPYLYAFISNPASLISGTLLTSRSMPVLKLIKAIGCSTINKPLIISVPTILRTVFCGAESEAISNDISEFTIVSCGEPLDISLAESLISKNISKFYNLYGSTEVSPWILWLNVCEYLSSLANTNMNESILPVGAPLPGVDAIIGDYSQLLVRSESVFQSYMGDKAEFKSINTLRYFNTGDIFEVKGDYFFCKGRLNNAVKICGHFVNPVFIEASVRKLYPGIDIVCVPCPLKNSIIICFSRASSECYAKSEIDQRSLKNSLKYDIPASVSVSVMYLSGGLERLPSGKINRKYYANAFETTE